MQDNKQPVPSAAAGALIPEMVKDIPIAAQGALQNTPQEDDDLDKIMKDVGQDIKKMGDRKPKHHLFSFRADSKPAKSQKTDAKFSARPIDQIKTQPQGPRPARTQTPASAKPETLSKQAPARNSRAPVAIILLAVVVTGALAAAAFYAYK